MGLKLPKINQQTLIYAGVTIVGVAAFMIYNKGIGGTAKAITSGIITGVVSGASGVIAGAYEAVPESVKPSSENNIIYKGLGGIGATISGDKNWTLGGWIYDITH